MSRASPVILSILSPHVEILATLYLFEELYSPTDSLFYFNFFFSLSSFLFSSSFLHSGDPLHHPKPKTHHYAETVNPSPRWANPHPDRPWDRQPKPRWANPSLDRPRDRQPKPTPSKPKLFLSFLLWRTEGENGEQRKCTAKRRKKIWKREKNRANERERKKKKGLNRPVKNNKQTGWRVYNNFSFVKTYCNILAIWRVGWRVAGTINLHFGSPHVEIQSQKAHCWRCSKRREERNVYINLSWEERDRTYTHS